MDSVRDNIRTVIPNIMDTVLDKVIDQLKLDGVAALDDLEYVTASDLDGILKPIETRKLLKAWASNDKVSVSTPCQNIEPARPVDVAPPSCMDNPSPDSDITYMDPSWPHKFNLNWNHLPAHVTRLLNRGERLVGKDRKCLIHATIDAVRVICRNPVKSQLNIIAKKIYDKYPHALTDQLNGSIIGCGYETFLKQLISRCENQNRGSINPLKRRLFITTEAQENEQSGEGSQKNKNCSLTDSFGCISWQPPIDDEEKVKELKAELSNFDNPGSDRAVELLELTYPLQRMEINSGKPLSDLLLEWPVLFSESGILSHFGKLTGFNVKKNKLSTSFKDKSSRILRYAENAPTSAKVCHGCIQVLKEYAAAKALTNDERPTVLAIIRLLMANLNEDEKALFHIVDENTVSSEVNLSQSPATPFLIVCGDSLLLARRFMLSVDGMIVLTRITSVISALSLLFAAYYCFNLEYPDDAVATLEFIQRCFVGINPGKGTKAGRVKKKTCTPMNAKVMTLIKALGDFEWAQAGIELS